MLTEIAIKNFKTFDEVTVPLGNGFTFVGPNNQGKTSALQALALWHVGLQKWVEKYGRPKEGTRLPKRAATVNRLDLIRIPVKHSNLIWRNHKVRRSAHNNIRIELTVKGISNGMPWKCGLEFEYANAETFFCRPLRIGKSGERMPIPSEAYDVNVAFLPPMSGIASEEVLVQKGQIDVLMGQGKTAEVLRNLCYRVFLNSKEKDTADWEELNGHIKTMFGVTLNAPEVDAARGTVVMSYRDGTTTLDLPSSGRGMQQALLLLAYLYDDAQDAVLLLDEPDAHLEVFRQRETRNLIGEIAEKRGGQVISATHSEELLNSSAVRGEAVAFVGKPHILGEGKRGVVLAALRDIGYQYYYGAESKGWILYLEGETDLRVLKAFADRLGHPVARELNAPLVKFISNLPNEGREHFKALREAKADLRGITIVDKIEKNLQPASGLEEYMWNKCAIENYLCKRAAILSYVADSEPMGALLDESRRALMEKQIEKLKDAYSALDEDDPFLPSTVKASDKFLTRLFKNFSKALDGKVQPLEKKDFYKLVRYIPVEEIDDEVRQVLDKIVAVANPKAAKKSR